MVNGKPTLTFGNAPTTAAASLRQQKARNSTRAAEAFASYLPGNEKTGQSAANAASAASARAAQGPGGGQTPFQADSFVARSVPTAYQQATIPGFPGGQGRQVPPMQPAGTMSRAEARGQARPGDPGMAASHARNFAAVQPQRISSKSSPRISTDRPITGRRNIGMVDTRKTPASNTTLAGRGDLGYASPNARAAQAGAPRSGPFVSGMPAPALHAPGSFSSYHNNLTSALGSQSFANQGFAGRNAEIALKKLGYDVRDMSGIVTRATRLDQPAVSHAGTLGAQSGLAFGSTRPIERESGADATRTALQTAANRRKSGPRSGSLVGGFHAAANAGLGNLAAKFESGEEGIAAIGYDSKGGTSYGKYQIASRVGTMNAFLTYLENKAPDLASRLKAAGPANTGGRSGRMPAEWRKIAQEDPTRFEALQSDFIRTSHFEPAMQAIAAATGVAFEQLPAAYQEVLFSTAVQHGPAGATRIISQALQKVDANKLTNQKNPSGRKAGEQLITNIYNLRAGQFVSSTSRVQSSVRNRLKQEMREAIDMLT